MAETQKIYDKEMRGIHSIKIIQCFSDPKTKDKIHKIKYINDIIQDLERFGPAGLIHIAVLSNLIKRSIKISNVNGNLNKIIGKRKTGHPLNIEYHPTDSEIGHWTLRNGKDPDNVVIDLNNCLFSVVGSQIGQNPLKLRKWTILKMKNNFQNLAKWIDKIKLEKNDKIILMIGGARYIGTSPNDAKELLNRSENEYCYNSISVGHARGHASATLDDCRQTVEQYSITKDEGKSGFLSREDQNYITHLALKTKDVQEAIERLNEPQFEETVKVTAENLKNVARDLEFDTPDILPKVKQWIDGKESESEWDITTVTLVLAHHMNEYKNKDADVFIKTCYPHIIQENSKTKKVQCFKEKKSNTKSEFHSTQCHPCPPSYQPGPAAPYHTFDPHSYDPSVQYYSVDPCLFVPSVQYYSVDPHLFDPSIQYYSVDPHLFDPSIQYYSVDPRLFDPSVQYYSVDPRGLPHGPYNPF